MKSRPSIVVTNRIHEEVAVRLSRHGDVDVNAGTEPWPRDELARRLAGADAMMGFMTDCLDADLLERAPHLKVVACALKGFDSYDVAACTRRGVWVTIVPDLLTEPTAELAVGLAIGLGRHIRQADAYIRDGGFTGWRPTFYGTGLAGSTVAIIGLGKVGEAIARRLAGFECRLLGCDPCALPPAGMTRVGLGEALAAADFVIVAAPLTPTTRHLLSRKQLLGMKRGALLINVGRGSVVDETAVAEALGEKHLAGYAADVFAFEDWLLDNRPRSIPAELLSHPATLFTPHIGSAVTSVRLAIEHRAADNIIAVLDGRAPPDAINQPLLK